MKIKNGRCFEKKTKNPNDWSGERTAKGMFIEGILERGKYCELNSGCSCCKCSKLMQFITKSYMTEVHVFSILYRIQYM
jgi:hypothetical protein